MSIIKALKNIEKENLTSFHMPGHKNGRLLDYLPYGDKISCYDTTEIEGTDNLHNPKAELKELEEWIANIYGTKSTHLLVNGTTSGVISMIYATFKKDDRVIVLKDAHRSVFSGIILSQLNPVYISSKVKNDIPMGVTIDDIRQVYNKYNHIKGIILSYPNYNGVCSDIVAISELVHKNNGVVLVDGAHGSHLFLGRVDNELDIKKQEKNLINKGLVRELPITAIESGADVVVHSTHKSLPAFTQSSMIHRCSDRISETDLRMSLSMFQSSSPSYLLMSSIENAMCICEDKGRELMHELLNQIDNFVKKVRENTVFDILTDDMLSEGFYLDKTKISILMPKTYLADKIIDKNCIFSEERNNILISGLEVENILRKEHAIQCEYSMENMILCIASIATTKQDLDKLYLALRHISNKLMEDKKVDNLDWIKNMDNKNNEIYKFQNFELECGITPYIAMNSQKTLVNLQDAVGEICGDFIIPYPPGIPIALIGEIITQELINYIEHGISKGYNIIGAYKNEGIKINIIKKGNI